MWDQAFFAEVLKDLRNRKKLSRNALALRLGLHPSSIEKWERGDVLPNQTRVNELVDALKCTESERLLLLEAHAGHRILPSLHNLPANRNPYFTGRTAILAQMHQHLAPGNQIALTQAISGLGGIGKTQVALEYVYRYQKQYSHLLWATADCRETLTTEFSRLAKDLDLPEKNEKDQGKVVQAVRRWLREYLDWLLVLDNIEDLGLVSEFVPAGHLGAVLLTTRRQVTEPVAQALDLHAFSEDEGTLFLLKRARQLTLNSTPNEIPSSEVEIARSITRQLGELPLALDQAGAYIVETGCSLIDYYDLFKQQHMLLLQRRGTVPGGHLQSVTTTFSLAFEQIQQKNKAAIELLKLCVYLGPDGIPLELIAQDTVHLGTTLEAIGADPVQFNQELEMLRLYSLVHRDGGSRTISLHRLVQSVLRDRLEDAEKRVWAERAVQAVDAAFPQVEYGAWQQCERLLPHALATIQFIEQYELMSAEAGRLLQQTASYLQDRGHYTEAEPLYQQALAIREQQLGDDHPDTATTLHSLAVLYWSRGKYTEAEPLYQRALAIREQHLGPEHPDTAMTLNDLALLYYRWGKYKSAEQLHKQALAIFEKVRGPDHPDTATSVSNFALLYDSQGRYAEAEQWYQRALSISEQMSGTDHQQTGMILISLAELYRQQGQYQEVESLCQRSLTIFKKQLGMEHPDTATSLHYLAALYADQGRYMEAESLYEQALHIREQRLGRDHPATATTLNKVAELHLSQGKYALAELVVKRALAICQQQLGSAHTSTATTLNSHAALSRSQGKYSEAEALYQQVLCIREQLLGREHPDMVYSLNGLADLYVDQKRYAEARRLYQQALSIAERRLGSKHPQVAAALRGLAHIYIEQGEYACAESFYQQALTIQEQIFGSSHPDAARTLYEFAILREFQSNHLEAIALYQRALSIYEWVYGSQHQKTAATRARLHTAVLALDCMDEGASLDEGKNG